MVWLSRLVMNKRSVFLDLTLMPLDQSVACYMTAANRDLASRLALSSNWTTCLEYPAAYNAVGTLTPSDKSSPNVSKCSWKQVIRRSVKLCPYAQCCCST
jgi:hypothetical protein